MGPEVVLIIFALGLGFVVGYAMGLGAGKFVQLYRTIKVIEIKICEKNAP